MELRRVPDCVRMQQKQKEKMLAAIEDDSSEDEEQQLALNRTGRRRGIPENDQNADMFKS